MNVIKKIEYDESDLQNYIALLEQTIVVFSKFAESEDYVATLKNLLTFLDQIDLSPIVEEVEDQKEGPAEDVEVSKKVSLRELLMSENNVSEGEVERLLSLPYVQNSSVKKARRGGQISGVVAPKNLPVTDV